MHMLVVSSAKVLFTTGQVFQQNLDPVSPYVFGELGQVATHFLVDGSPNCCIVLIEHHF